MKEMSKLTGKHYWVRTSYETIEAETRPWRVQETTKVVIALEDNAFRVYLETATGVRHDTGKLFGNQPDAVTFVAQTFRFKEA
ncbi:unnamed protein product [marine sediment metagenome]|uniref:Uncharacterized protein n=1 Tax=marine sediment metagenome TaxID=412755 RepID=X1C5L2_9ZZZZ